MKTITQKLCLLALVFTTLNAYCQIPKLSSFPSAAPTIFLDFDGHTVQYAGWQSGNAFVCAPAALSITQITEIFNRVSEDYRPFAVNITTDSTKFIAAPLTQRIRIIVTPTSAWYNAPGVAYTNSFTWGDDAPGFVFPDKLSYNPKKIAEGCSHESGHTLGLSHQSTYNANCVITQLYNAGSGTGETSWAPIMGSSYINNMTGWNIGPTPYDCVVVQDNISIITTNNGFGFRADDYPETMNTNTTSLNINAINTSGIITTTTDKDAFKLTMTQNSNLHLEATPFNIGANAEGANLDVMLSLYNNSNVLIRTYNPINTMNVVIDTTLAIGTYYIVVDGTGNNNTSQYGSLGSYNLTGFKGGTVLAIHSVNLQGKNFNNKHQLNWNIISDEPIIKQVVEVSSNAIDFSPIMTDATGAKNYDYTPRIAGTIFYRLKVTSSTGETSYSNIVALKANGDEKLFIVSTLVQQDIKVTATENFTYNLYDGNARLITTGTARKGISNINIANLAKGMYILQMMNENYKQTERIIKQ